MPFAAASLVTLQAIDVVVVRIAVVGERGPVAARGADAVARLVTDLLHDREPRLGDRQILAADRLVRITDRARTERIGRLRRRSLSKTALNVETSTLVLFAACWFGAARRC